MDVFRKLWRFGILCRNYCSSVGTSSSIHELLRQVPPETVCTQGWIYSIRKVKDLRFVKLYDGLSSQTLQVVLGKDIFEGELSTGAAVSVYGKMVSSPGRQQTLELVASQFTLHGSPEITGQQILPRVDYAPNHLRRSLVTRSKSPNFAALLRIRSKASRLLHDYFQDRNFVLVDAPVITATDSEGAGENFMVQAGTPEPSEIETDLPAATSTGSNEFFSKPVFLTVSKQLHLEAVAGGLSRVYTFGPTFRAEKSLTRQHLAEFHMLEAELAFMRSLHELMDVVEDMFKMVLSQLAELCREDIKSLGSFDSGKGLLPTGFSTSDASFPRIQYSETIRILAKSGRKFEFYPKHGRGLQKEHERYLVEYCDGSPVFVTHFPTSIKPFYMKTSETTADHTVECFDLLCPELGEVCGGSLREDNFDRLAARCHALLGENSHSLSWYCNLRKLGYAPCGGFGLGFERFLQTALGIANVKDCVPFPRWYKNCHL